ncbi:MAG: Asp23/Gls24 family envelope stress response protein [Candidatus Promineifilaceae bacterium]|nr:Asp23/Gls24 family envelope stress response protein [Candidatus Promineifilaceae bacterium]
MSTSEESLGQINISPSSIATIATRSVHQCYGVVGMASRNVVDGITYLLTRDPRHGIDVSFTDEGIVIDVYVIVEYGTRIRVVAQSIQNTVKFHVERAMDAPVSAVNVYVQGLRISGDGD